MRHPHIEPRMEPRIRRALAALQNSDGYVDILLGLASRQISSQNSSAKIAPLRLSSNQCLDAPKNRLGLH